MNANKALWEKGDFTRIARGMRRSGEALASSFGIEADMAVLDLGCGDGTTAIPAARLAREVVGIDIASNLVAAGIVRATAEGLDNIRFEEGDACDLAGVPDDRFDLVVSFFGAMFAPRPLDVAREMARVTRPGGRIIMGNWIPDDPTLVAQILKTSAAHAPPPPEGFISPMRWGIKDEVITRFAAAGVAREAISFGRDSIALAYDGTPAEMLDAFLTYYGPMMTAMEHAERNGTAVQLKAELAALFAQQDRSADSSRTEIPATFLRVTVSIA